MPEDSSLSRKEFLAAFLLAAAAAPAAALGSSLPRGPKPRTPLSSFPFDLYSPESPKPQTPDPRPQTSPQPGDDITVDDLKAAEKLLGISFTDDERRSILGSVKSAYRGFIAARAQPVTYQVEPPALFTPFGRQPAESKVVSLKSTPVRGLKKPEKAEDVAFLSVRELGNLVKTKQISPVELTKLYLDRMKAYGDKLLCLVTLTEDLAMKQAKRAEDEIMAGKYRGPLHGLPCGVKDLLATKGIPTTWGSEPHKDQVFDYDAGVVERLDQAGAVLIAKLSMGALAQGDVWFKGRTKNPWNPAQGSSGSSAGPACASAAGLVAFAIGTETLGSIVSPSHQCRVTGLRPTYGRVSRYGAMAVSWTNDKIGPICRNAEDCAIVFAAICGADPRDRTSVDRPFRWNPNLDLKKLKIGFLIGQNDDPKDLSRLEKDDYLKILVALGAKPVPVRFDPAPPGISAILSVESAAAFDDFTRSDKIQLLKNSAWPTTYRANRYVPAVEFLQAMRVRSLMMEKFERQFGDLDLFVAFERGGNTLVTTNSTGHPQVLVPWGSTDTGAQKSISFVGRLHGEETILAAAHQVQLKGGFLKLRPDLGKL